MKLAKTLILTVCLVATACKMKPSYPGNQVASAVEQMLAKDYKMRVESRRVGNTLQIYFWHLGLFKVGQLEIQPKAAEALDHVLLSAVRVALSTDAPLQFLEIKMMDALSGGTITLLRYVPDVRDSIYVRMGDEEYVNRLVIEMDKGEGPIPDRKWKEIRWDPPVTMGEFLAKQVVLRAKRGSSDGLQAHEDVSSPNTLVVVMDNWDSIQGERQQEKLTDLVEQTAKTVLKNYRYEGFHELVVKDAVGGLLRARPL